MKICIGFLVRGLLLMVVYVCVYCDVGLRVNSSFFM